jgi:transcriptional regulator with XRE-family HTH domain
MRKSAGAREFVGAVGRNIREARRARRLTLESLAKALDTDVPAVSRTETAKRDPRCSELYEFAKALGVTPPDLVAVKPVSPSGLVRRSTGRRSGEPSHRRS